MQNIVIKTKVLTKREYSRLKWRLRAAKKFELTEATKAALLSIKKPLRGMSVVTIEVGCGAYPENCFLDPVFSVLRSSGWIADDATVILKNGGVNGIMLTLNL
jgi:hypothetical protein